MLDFESNPSVRFRVRALSADKEELLSVSFESLEYIFSPIVLKTYDCDELMIGFCASANIFSGGNVNCGRGTISANGLYIAGYAPLAEVQSIEYSCEPLAERASV
jgi:hypothetical protein